MIINKDLKIDPLALQTDVRSPSHGDFAIPAITFVGRQLFDAISRTTPVLVMGVMNILLIIAALCGRAAGHPQEPLSQSASSETP